LFFLFLTFSLFSGQVRWRLCFVADCFSVCVNFAVQEVVQALREELEVVNLREFWSWSLGLAATWSAALLESFSEMVEVSCVTVSTPQSNLLKVQIHLVIGFALTFRRFNPSSNAAPDLLSSVVFALKVVDGSGLVVHGEIPE
jgi:hypothetical protein